MPRIRLGMIFVLGMIALGFTAPSHGSAATNTFRQVCPAAGVQERGPAFEPGGIILTTFDRENLWVYDIDNNNRYPLPDTFPCGSNCRLSHDARWITYFNDRTNTYDKMRLDGTERTRLVDYAADVEWWTPDTLLVWTPGHKAYLRPELEDRRQYLNVNGVLSVQPGGRWGLLVEQTGDFFTRSLVNLELRGLPGLLAQRIALGVDQPYFNASAWSPSGQWLAYVSPGALDPQLGISGGEIFAVQPSEGELYRWTDLTSHYGATRINGLSVGDLSWSPDGTRIAFWVTELTGSDPTANTGNAIIHILHINTGEINVYCDYSTFEHTPNTPRLVWSPDSTHIAFGGNIPADDRGYLLLILDTTTGIYTSMSEGIYPAMGSADVIAWGRRPG